MHKVLITGITGFLGSHIAEILIQQNVQVVGLKRLGSDTWRCRDFEKQVDWVDIDDAGLWKSSIAEKRPACIVHTAWIGVEARYRNIWSVQAENVYFLAQLLELAQSLSLDKFIFMGSQAEYGNINGKIAESEAYKAVDAYGGIKLACLEMLKTFCETNQVNWIWLRVFSVFGERESGTWLIPSIIGKMLKEKEMDFTAGDQMYAYLYVKDFASIICTILSVSVNSGIYNMSSTTVQPLKSVIKQIRDLVNPEFKLNFGALPYRPFQSMHMEGDMTKIMLQIGIPKFTDFNIALQNTVKYYTSK